MNIYSPLQNKYYQWYQNLINKAKTRTLDNTVYQEKHHIVPKSFGGSDSQDNLVSLTMREHYVAHLLLSKSYEGEVKRKMMYALWIMLLQEKDKGSRVYEMYRQNYINVSLKTHKHTDEMKHKISVGVTGVKKTITEKLKNDWEERKTRMVGSGNPMFGRKQSEETKRKIAEKAKNRVLSEETKQKIRQSCKNHHLKES